MGHVREKLTLEAIGLQHPPFELFALGDIANGARHQRAAVGFQRAEADLDRELCSVFSQPEQFEPDAHPSRPRVTEEPGAVPGMRPAKALGNEELDPFPDEFVSCVAEEPLRLGVDQDDAPVLVDDDHGVRSGLQQVLESFLRLLAITDVTDRGRDERLTLGVEGTQADFNRKRRPVPPQAGELQAGPHGPDARFREEIGSVPGMRFTDTFRDEDFHRLAQELRPRVAEQLFRLCVDDGDVAIAVDDHDGVRRRFEQAPEFRLAGLQLAQAPEHRRVTLADGDHRFVVGSMQHHLDGNQHAVLAPANGFYGDRTALHDLAQA